MSAVSAMPFISHLRKALPAIWLGGLLVQGLAGCGLMGTQDDSQALREQARRDEALQQEAAAHQQSTVQARGLCQEAIDPALGLKLSMARQQQTEGRYYAALAGLDTLHSDLPTYRLVRADLLRNLGQYQQADSLYQALESTCLQGQALYGQGLDAAWQGHLSQALTLLASATRVLPTDADLRNDYGFMLLMSGQTDAARAQLMTALELEADHRQAARNLWFLLLQQQDEAGAQALARRFGWQAQDLAQMRRALASFRPVSLATP